MRLSISLSLSLSLSGQQLCVVPHLLHAMANTAHTDSQKQASLALHVSYDLILFSDDVIPEPTGYAQVSNNCI